MSKITDTECSLELMVNCKTYPAISKKYVETVCTGGVERNGNFVRLYPIPFRFLDNSEKYDRWNVVRVRVYRDLKDSRPESWHLEPGTPIEIIDHISTERRRWDWMKKAVFPSRASMAEQGLTNGLVHIEPLEFFWKPDEKEWTASQKAVIAQGDLFADPTDKAEIANYVPWQFRLKYREVSTGEIGEGKVLQWSYYQGYRRNLVDGDEEAALRIVADRIRKSIFNPDRRVFAIFGTHSRYKIWMISALYHVPLEIVLAEENRPRQLF
jgi:hypothetical protein